MSSRILITGCSGLIGTALCEVLRAHGHGVVGLDVRAMGDEQGDVRSEADVRAATSDCSGVIHLAAVSRVVWGERDPELCRQVNVGGLETVVAAIERRRDPPWLIFASSREVYGQATFLPVAEDAEVRPINVYAHTKVDGERLIDRARARGVRAATLRLSNVYGGVTDHCDRVVPAFVRAAVAGTPLRVDGAGHTFDFTHVDDVARGFLALTALLTGNTAVPPTLHLVTGTATTLGELARLAVACAGTRAPLVAGPERDYDVAHFVGDPTRAERVLGWRSTTTVTAGVAREVAAARDRQAAAAGRTP